MRNRIPQGSDAGASHRSGPRKGDIGTFRRAIYEWLSQFLDPASLIRALRGTGPFISDFRSYRRMEGGGALLRDIVPRLGDATVVTPFDAHYFYMSSWAMRRVYERAPSVHVDVGGSAALIACLAAIVPTVFVDYRPLVAQLPGMCSVGGDVRTLPFKTQSVESLSCLHVAEHVGLGRYGDPLDPMGTARAADELARVLAPKGTLLFAIPVGRDRVHFNAHRVLAPEAVVGIFPSLSLEEFSVVTDEDRFVDGVEVGSLGDARYSCGLFRFVRR